jgi:hypothetical protein
LFGIVNIMNQLKNLFLVFQRCFSTHLVIVVFLLTSSCGDHVPSVETTTETEDYLEFRSLYLGQYGLPALLMIPDETANIGATTEPEILHEDGDFLWTIKAGPNFTLRIEDFGDYSKRLEDKKKELAEQNKFTIRYLTNEPGLIVYEQTLIVKGMKNAPPKVGVEHSSLHVYGQSKINGIYYELQSPDQGFSKYNRHTVNLMAKSIRSFKAIRSTSADIN